MMASLQGGLCFQKGLGAIHALSHPIGAWHHTHHGTTNAVCMPAVLQFNKDVIAERFDMAAAYLGIKGGFVGFCDYVNGLNDALGVPKSLTELGVKDPDIETLTEAALKDPSVGGNPVEMTYENTKALLESLV